MNAGQWRAEDKRLNLLREDGGTSPASPPRAFTEMPSSKQTSGEDTCSNPVQIHSGGGERPHPESSWCSSARLGQVRSECSALLLRFPDEFSRSPRKMACWGRSRSTPARHLPRLLERTRGDEGVAGTSPSHTCSNRAPGSTPAGPGGPASRPSRPARSWRPCGAEGCRRERPSDHRTVRGSTTVPVALGIVPTPPGWL